MPEVHGVGCSDRLRASLLTVACKSHRRIRLPFEVSSKCRYCSWLKICVAGGMIVVRQRGLIAATGISNGVDGEHYYQNSDAVNPVIGDHD